MPELSVTNVASVPYPPPPNTVLMPPLITIVPTESTMISAAASILRRVRSVSGRNIAKTSAFHTQAHLVQASTGKAADSVVTAHQASSSPISAWRKVKRLPFLLSSSSQPANAATNATRDTG